MKIQNIIEEEIKVVQAYQIPNGRLFLSKKEAVEAYIDEKSLHLPLFVGILFAFFIVIMLFLSRLL